VIQLYKINMNRKGFTLIEILVVFSIVGILAGLTLAASMSSRKVARDGKRKADLEQIRSALEMYRADKGYYPPKDATGWCTVLWGCNNPVWYDAVAGALISGEYLSSLPQDPLSLYAGTNKDYFFRHVSNNKYELYSELEGSNTNVYSTSGCACGRGSAGDMYDYKLTNP